MQVPYDRVVQIPPNVLRLPDVRQQTNYTCGPVALQAVLGYYGEEHFEEDLAELCGADPEEGTPPDRLVRAARELGFQAEVRQNMTLADLEQSIADRVPVMIAAQAWRDEDQKQIPWENLWDSGHWMVVVGLDKDKVYFEDPSILGSLGEIPREEFLQRWHDIDGTTPFVHGGILITGKPPAPPPLTLPVD